MAKFYSDLGDAMNKVSFELRIPDDYTPVVPGYYRQFPDRKPLFSDTQPFSYTKMPCSHVVDMCELGVEFMIAHRADVETIFDIISAYVDELQAAAKGREATDPVVIYLNKCNVALNVLREHQDRARRERLVTEKSRAGTTLKSILDLVKW